MLKTLNKKLKTLNSSGQLSLQVLILGSVAIVLISGFVVWADTYVKSVSRDVDRSQAFTIAEAGIEYYRWHLAHAPLDFTDGQASSTGPYIHPYYDKSNNLIGQFELVITPPASGSTITTIESTGKVVTDPTITKVIKATMALPSLAQYSVLSNDNIRFGEGTVVYGKVHSNGGVRLDGVAYNVVASARATYNDPDHSGGDEFGVHTHLNTVDPSPPAEVPVRNDVFAGGRQFPVPAVDFGGITSDLASIKSAAQSAGFYKGNSGGYGYDLVLKTDDTFDLYKVTKLVKAPNGCPQSQKNWGTWSISTESFIGNYAFPSNGVLFFEDDLWVRGQINTARLMIAAARFPENSSTYATITTNNDLTYTNFDGQDVIGLISQGDINVGLYSEDDLVVNAAQVAQHGRIGRFYHSSKCGAESIRSKVTMYGMIATYERYGWAYTDGTGYQTRVIVYDGNLLYNPPPMFPVTAGQYDTISWEEVR